LRASRAIGLYFVAVILLGALLAPWLFWGVQQVAPRINVLHVYATYPFHRIFDRAIMLVALAGLWPLLRVIGFRFWSEIGYVQARGWWRHVLGGYILGVVSLTAMVALIVVFGGQQLVFTKTSGQMAGAAVKFFFVGVVVAVIEETCFRGALQGSLERWIDVVPDTITVSSHLLSSRKTTYYSKVAMQRRMNLALAIGLASAVYSVVHFLKPNGVNIPANQVTWTSGGQCLVWVVTQSLVQKGVLVGFVSLFLVGCVLGLAYAETEALYLPVGLHAGWVLVNEFLRWSSTIDVIQDVASWPMLMVLLVMMVWLCQTIFKPLRGHGLSSFGHGAR
jgi:membrane protease YdiL (CAAX protease family)